MEGTGLVASGRRIVLYAAVGLVMLAWPAVSRAAFAGQVKLTSADGGFGQSVALSPDGDTALIGNGDSAAVYTRTGTTWALQARLVPPAGSEVGNARFGSSVALSDDGNTALVGGYSDNASVGAAWVFTRSGTTWTEQTKLKAPSTGADKELGAGQFGFSAALSPDGNTALIGANTDSSNKGAGWIFDRIGSAWSERAKLTAPTSGSDVAIGNPQLGWSAQLAVDTAELNSAPNALLAALGGPSDSGGSPGAVYTFTDAVFGSWLEQQRLVPSNGTNITQFGDAVALTPDGSELLVGGPGDGSALGTGAVWVFARAGLSFTQQARLLAPAAGSNGAIGPTFFGDGIGLSSDGTTAAIGGLFDNAGVGAAWVASRTGPTWSVGTKLTAPTSGADAEIGTAGFGTSVALSDDGRTLLAGTPTDNSGRGAVWVFANAPSVTTISPPAGPASGGTTVAIKGARLSRTFAVSFGTVPASSFTVVSDSEVDAVTPPGDPAPVDITVATPTGTSPIGLADRFTYFPSAPGAPTAVTAHAQNKSAGVSFTPPRANGSAITSYRVVASPGGAAASGSGSPITVTGLKNGTSYTFTVAATNGIGTGPASAPSNAVVPTERPPKVSHISLTGTHTRKPKLSFMVTAAKGSDPLKSVAVRVPKGLAFAGHPHRGLSVGPRHAKFTAKVKHSALTVTLKTAKPTVKVVASPPALRLTRTLSGKVALMFTIVDSGHAKARVTSNLKVH